jgi:hypothetical protein
VRKHALDHVGLDGDQQDFQFAVGAGAENLEIPRDLLERERNVLFGLVLNDLVDLRGINGRKFDELGEDVEPGRAGIDLTRTETAFGNQVLDCLDEDALARHFL